MPLSIERSLELVEVQLSVKTSFGRTVMDFCPLAVSWTDGHGSGGGAQLMVLGAPASRALVPPNVAVMEWFLPSCSVLGVVMLKPWLPLPMPIASRSERKMFAGVELIRLPSAKIEMLIVLFGWLRSHPHPPI